MTLQKKFLQNLLKNKRKKDQRIKEWNEDGHADDLIKTVKNKISDRPKIEDIPF